MLYTKFLYNNAHFSARHHLLRAKGQNEQNTNKSALFRLNFE